MGKAKIKEKSQADKEKEEITKNANHIGKDRQDLYAEF